MMGTSDRPPVWSPLAGRDLPPPLDGERLAHALARREALSTRMAARSVREIGAFRTAGDEYIEDNLPVRLSIAAEHRRLWRAVLEMLVASGHLHREGRALRANCEFDAAAGADLDGEADRLVDAYPELGAQIRLLRSCAAEFPRLLRGELNPVHLLFPGSSTELVEAVYRGDPFSDALNDLVAQVTAAHVETGGSGTDGASVRIVEVGAGTGGTTAQVLPVLARHADRVAYTCTDLSLGLLRHSRRKFAQDHQFVTFKRLDIENTPASQGFEEAGYDVVIAANVLHATRNLRETLANVRVLLRPGGALVLRESTAFFPFLTMTFGLLDGWWRFTDVEQRIPGSPLASTSTWRRLLLDTGFGQVAVLSPVSCDAEAAGQHVVIGRLGSALAAEADRSGA